MIFSKKIPPGDKHLIQHRWKNLYKFEDIYKKLYEAYSIYKYAIQKRGSAPKFKNHERLGAAIKLIQKIEEDSDFVLTPKLSSSAIIEFEKALIQLKALGKSKTKS
jgi:hypothetical protein